jgi:hypothetical protein
MKPEEIEVGAHKAGVFTVIVSLPVFTTEPGNYFEVLVHQRGKDGVLYNVHLVEDERFAIFQHLTTFQRKLTDEDLVEYNSYTTSVFHRYIMPTFKLSRRSIVALFEVCHRLSKKLR